MVYKVTQTVNIAHRCQGIAFKHRAPRAIKTIKEVVERTIRDQEVDVIKVDELLNTFIWQQGIRNPPRKVRVQTIVEELDGKKVATIYYVDQEQFKGLKKEEETE